MAELRATLNTLLGLGVCTDPAEADKCMGWARELWDAMQPCATGDVYVNYRGQEAEEGGRTAEGRLRPREVSAT